MEFQLISLVVNGLLGIAGYFMRTTLAENKSELRRLDSELQTVRREYLHKDDFRDFKVELREMFQEIKKDIKELKTDA